MKKALTIALAAALASGTMMAQAYQQGDWVLRVGATTVDPDTDSDDINLPQGVVAQADVDDDTQLGIIPMYMVTDKFGVELLAATPFEHDISADVRGSSLSVDAGSTKQLPPTLVVQWYPRGGEDGWQPYIGIGLNYTLFFDEDVDNELVDTLGALTDGVVQNADLDLDDSFGLAAQAGIDIPFSDRWAFNIGVWYIDIDTEAEITAKAAGGAQVAKVKFDVDIDPWVYNIGIAYKF
ncbi:MAG: outer membrane beta-barrel protein [Haliea sp.]|jgi:outer membrane protein|nr:outer membrane beta-barrel protein [Haliea sp.]